MINGRQIAFMMRQEFKQNDTDLHIMNFNFLKDLRLKGDNLLGFDYAWSEALLPFGEDLPPENILFTFYDAQIQQSGQLKDVLTFHNIEVSQKGKPNDYAELRRIVKVHLETKQQRKIRAAYDAGLTPKWGNPATEKPKSSSRRVFVGRFKSLAVVLKATAVGSGMIRKRQIHGGAGAEKEKIHPRAKGKAKPEDAPQDQEELGDGLRRVASTLHGVVTDPVHQHQGQGRAPTDPVAVRALIEVALTIPNPRSIASP